jgi:3-hydroxyisobutyrate dehydrogenase-like beta-hydroxyacid dehydrogenase/predicted transcriptional regulator
MGLSDTIQSAVQWGAQSVDMADSLRTAIARMAQAGTSALVVKSGGEVVGLVTDQDLMGSVARGDDLDTVTVAGFMTPCEIISGKEVKNPCVQLDETQSVGNAIGVMDVAGTHHLLVTGERGVGVISAHDLLRLADEGARGLKIAVLGLGIIGSVWAKHLIADGHTVRCWNRTPKDLPNFHASIPEAVAGAEVIIIVVADPPAVQAILDQIQGALAPGVLVIQSSTISAKWTRHFAEQVQRTGAQFLEAPFTGSKPAAEGRQIVYFLGGEPKVVERGRPILEKLARAVLQTGPLGSASTLKLAMNLNLAGVAMSLSESLTLSRAAGISDELYFSALAHNASHSTLSDMKSAKLRLRDYAPQFSLKHMEKDLRLALETAAELSVTLEQTGKLKALYDKGITAGWAEEDFIGLMRLMDK